MLKKWKIVITNWINCYFNDEKKKVLHINLETLVGIISHLRDNFSLDESKSSLLDAHTVQEFIIEKFPNFKFENGSTEPESEDEVYTAASLLLYFVCVNSKDVYIRSAMCKNLQTEDQEVILKFTKCLMACSNISLDNVWTAIKESCIQAIPGPSLEQFTVSQTPPALRSLHSEVRRLQASLDAERFDRNFLQEELSRTNLKLEKLVKDKENYKLEVLNLKAKISLCCGQKEESQMLEPKGNNSTKLKKQLEETEQRLVNVQEQMDDLQHERDVYKCKLDETKRQYDILLNLNQQETTRANQLTEELENERQRTQSLEELVSELRQHNRLNGLDSSQLECDDNDISFHSPLNNTSICSEACANVIEVQLGEERAKIVVLETQIKELKTKLTDLSKKFENERIAFGVTVSQKDTEIKNLNHIINEEVEVKNTMKLHFDNEINKLSSDLDEMQIKLKESNETSKRDIATKMQEIQTLQEEKLSLLQSLNNEVAKLENVIKNLQVDIEAEKSSKNKLREEYEKTIMLLNDKALNRNNELFELQDKINENGEMIENLQMQLKSEKELKDDISNKHNNDLMNLATQRSALEKELQNKCRELLDAHMQLKQYTDANEELKTELECVKNSYTKSQEECKVLEENKEKLLNEIKNRDTKIEKLENDIDGLESGYGEMKTKLICDLNESQATINTLKSQLHDEIKYKLGLQNRIFELENIIAERDNTITEKELKLKEINENFVGEKSKFKEKLNQLTNDITEKKTVIKTLKAEVEQNRLKQASILEDLEDKLKSEEQEKIAEQEKNISICKENDDLQKVLEEKSTIIASLHEEINKFSKLLEEKCTVIQQFEDSAAVNKKLFDELQHDFNIETSKLAVKLTDTEKSLKELKSKSNCASEKYELSIQTLKIEKECLNKIIQDERETLAVVESEKTLLLQKLSEETSRKSSIEKEYLKKCELFNNITSQYSEEVLKNKSEIAQLSKVLKEMETDNTKKCADLKTLECDISQAETHHKEIILQKETEIYNLQCLVEELKLINTELQNQLKTETEMKKQALDALQRENVQLQYSLEEDNISHEMIVKEKNSLIEDLEGNVQSLVQQLEIVKQNYDADTKKWEKMKFELEQLNNQKDKQIHDYIDIVKSLNEVNAEKENAITDISSQNNMNLEIISEMNEEIVELKKACDQGSNDLKHTLATEKAVRDSLESEKKNLLVENSILLQKTLDDQTAYRVLKAERDSLLNEKALMIQELLEEKNMRKMVEEEKETISLQKKQVLEELDNLKNFKETLIQEKECLTQQLIDEGLNKKMLEQEKSNMADKKAELDEKLATEILNRMHLEKQFNQLTIERENLTEDVSKLKTMINALENEKSKLYQQVESFIVEKEESLAQIELLKNNMMDLTNVKNDLMQEKTDIIQEKVLLMKISNEMKQKLDDVTSEKDQINQRFEQISQQYSVATINSEEEMKNITSEFKHLQSDYKPEKFTSILDVAESLIQELTMSKKNENGLNEEIKTLKESRDKHKQKVLTLEEDIQNLLKEIGQQSETLESKTAEIKRLQKDNESLHNELTGVRIQLDEKVHSLKDKLIDNENLTDKLRETYECQIDNLNMMVTKLTNYLKDKTVELDGVRNERDKLQETIDKNNQAIKSFEEEIKTHKQIQEKLISEFESERQVLKNMITVTESVMEDQKTSLNKVINVHVRTIDALEGEIATLKELINVEKSNSLGKLNEKDHAFEALFRDLDALRKEKENLETKLESEISGFQNQVTQLTDEKGSLYEEFEKCRKDIVCKDEENNELKIKLDVVQKERDSINKDLGELKINNSLLQEQIQSHNEILNKVTNLERDRSVLQREKGELIKQINELNVKLEANIVIEEKNIELVKMRTELEQELKNKEMEINDMKSRLDSTLDENKRLSQTFDKEKQNLINKCNLLQEYHDKAKVDLEKKQKEIDVLQKSIEMLKGERENAILSINNKNLEIKEMNRKLTEEKSAKEHYLSEIKALNSDVGDLRQRLDDAKIDLEVVNVLRKENEELIQLVGQRETFAVTSREKSPNRHQVEKELRQLHNQVDNNSTDSHTSTDSFKTISDLEIILHDKNRTITSLQSDITYLKSLLAESENKLLDVSKDLELSKENCQQLSCQIKKIVYQKNEEIAELKKQVSKMSVTENRATQIIKLSARYQAMILKRVAEIKSTSILKELSNFGNSTTSDNEIRRNLNAGTITMEDLENFLETTDRHLKRCSEKQIALQKERDRLSEVNRINESEVINMRKFLTELSVSVKTFNSMKELYSQKLSRVVSLQRTVRREILNLDGHITDATMCKLERGYAAVMQDLSECAMNMERWVERCIGRTISSEKIKQAFTSEMDRLSLSSSGYQNASLEVQLGELENSFQKLLEEVSSAKSGDGAKDAQSVTLMEVRAEYEDKLNRMKAKMKQLYQEQISIFKERQKEEISALEKELEETRNKLEESSRTYQEHIRSLTTELWNVGEKFLMKKDEAEWLRKTQRSGSLMSLQHVHSSGLVAHQEEPSRPSDCHSLRSLPVTNNTKETRGVHTLDEEGEVFDNRWLNELQSTPKKEKVPNNGQRLSELKWRNSLCPPHLKSSYPAETQFVQALQEDDIKMGSMSLGGRGVRKEVGITAYKKPGPPTPSKQAGRLSATDSELRESLRVEAEPNASRKTSTPSRLRSLFRPNKNDTTESTPRSRRLSNIFRKK
ncbi:thyroid receptor-interacting protein 11-like isoform X2 [Pieris napi]|uniref:thyroid receptor-interacting protein 11-like isoform X2 n=1 Tax=Pieris napi TaxID=78633 RepID=UPI001FB91A22|nr:thyroid receptor-interacting protein 11-like isoform X2 [Pieris napi]